VIALYLGAPVFLHIRIETLLAALVFVIGSDLIGYYAGRSDPEQRQVTTVAAALGNPGLTLAVVASSFPGFKAAAFVAAFVIFRKLALIPLELWWKQRARVQSPPAQGAAPA